MKLSLKTVVPLLLISFALMSAQTDQSSAMRRLTPSEIVALSPSGAGAGSSGVTGIQTTVLYGDPTKAGLYTIRLSVPAHTTIQAHLHQDNRAATVVSGTWYIGYGSHFDEPSLKELPPGSFYTEPPSQNHFAQTKAEPVVVYITGYGPTSTTYFDKAADPRKP